VVNLSGTAEFEAADGTKVQMEPGDILEVGFAVVSGKHSDDLHGWLLFLIRHICR
jgi:hypothetical protein